MTERVLYVCTVDSMVWNFLVPHIKALQNAGYQVEVACAKTKFTELLRKNYDLKIHEINLFRSPFNIRNLKGLIQTINIIRCGKFGIIHSHEPVGGMIGRIAGKLCGAQVYYTVHGFHFHPNGSSLTNAVFYLAEKLLSFLTDRLFVMNEFDYKAAKRLYGHKPVVFTHGVGLDISKYSPCYDINKLNNLRNSLNISKNEIVVGTIAEFIPRKRYDIFLQAAKRILEQYENYKFLLIGEGYLKEEMEQRAKQMGISDKLIFAGYQQDVSTFLNIMDVFLFTSIQEGLPRAVMEAMAMGKAVVASDIRGVKDLIDSGIDGWLVPCKDVDSFTGKVILASKDTGMGKQAELKIKQNYTVEKVVSELLPNYSQSVKSPISSFTNAY